MLGGEFRRCPKASGEAGENLLRSAFGNQTGRASRSSGGFRIRVDRHCECLSIHTSGTDPFVRSRARAAPVSVVSLHGPPQLLDLVAVIA